MEHVFFPMSIEVDRSCPNKKKKRARYKESDPLSAAAYFPKKNEQL